MRYYECTCAECGGPINECEDRYRFIALNLIICGDCVEEAKLVGVYDQYAGKESDDE